MENSVLKSGAIPSIVADETILEYPLNFIFKQVRRAKILIRQLLENLVKLAEMLKDGAKS